MAPALLTVLGACSHYRIITPPSDADPAVYDVISIGAIGRRYVTETYTLRFSHLSRTNVEIQTLHSSGNWEAADWSVHYDSKSPKNSDPWPVSIQFAIGRVPTEVRLGNTGRPEELMRVDQWKEAGWESVRELGLPDAAKTSVKAMLDTDSVIRNLARDFPGWPHHKINPWVRTLQIAGITVTLEQRCETVRNRRQRQWTCIGALTTAGTQRGQLIDLKTETHLEMDHLGLVTHLFTYDGVLVRRDSAGALSHHAIAGKRKVQRR